MTYSFQSLRYGICSLVTAGLLMATQPAQALTQPVERSAIAQAIHNETYPKLLSNAENRDSTAYWTNALYASGGSASGNAALIALYIALEILPPLAGLGNWTAGNELLIAGSLVLIPVITTPLFMHLWSPAVENDWPIWLWSGSASLLSSILHAGLMVGAGIALNEFTDHNGSFSENFYLLAPAGIVSGMLIESLTTAQGHQFATRWQIVQAPGNGFLITQNFQF